MSTSKKALWLTWETQRRNLELATAFDAKLIAIDLSKLPPLLRYLISSAKTISLITHSRPTQVFAEFPSLVLCLLLSLLRYVFAFQLIIDAHNAMIRFYNHKNFVIRVLTRWVVRQADFLIVSNEYLRASFHPYESKVLVLPDKLPQFQQSERPERLHESLSNIVYISSFAEDEPTEAFLIAAKGHTDSAKFFVTGSIHRAGELLSYAEKNITFTDFLPQNEFDGLIQHADIIVDLSTDPNCLVCGAYEALAAETPCIISDSKASRTTFPKGFWYTESSSTQIAQCIHQALKEHDTFKASMKDAKQEFLTRWKAQLQSILRVIRA